MAKRKIQLLRSTTIYDSLDSVTNSFTSELAESLNMRDGEMLLARYRAEVPSLGGSNSYTVKSVLGIYNNKSDLSGFTLIYDSELIFRHLDDIRGQIARLKQKYTVSSSDESITVAVTDEGTDVIANVDGTTIVKDTTNKYLKSGLTLAKITTGLDSNVREAYQLQDNTGAQIGSQIDIYKDSALKEVYLGTSMDSVNSETGEVKRIRWYLPDGNKLISQSAYDELEDFEKALYTAEENMTFYGIKDVSLSESDWAALLEEVQSLYTNARNNSSMLLAANPNTNAYVIRDGFEIISSATFDNLTSNQRNQYELLTTTVYRFNDDTKLYLTQSEYETMYSGEGVENHIYAEVDPIILGKISSDSYQSLNFVYYLTDGTYEMVKVDLSKFLVEKEIGDGLIVGESGSISVNLGDGLKFSNTSMPHSPISIKLDETTNTALSLSENGLKLDLSDITNNALNEVVGTQAIGVSAKANNQQTVTLNLSEQLSTTADAQYAGETSTTTTQDPDTGEDVTTTTQISNNVLQVKNDGLYLDAIWDCGEYGVEEDGEK